MLALCWLYQDGAALDEAGFITVGSTKAVPTGYVTGLLTGDASQQLTAGQRYEELIARTQWWGRQMLIWGVHVHVGVRSPDKSIAIVNALSAYVPHFLALSASSPY